MRSSKRRFEIRKARVRSAIARVSDRPRLSVFKSGKHVYAQIIDDIKSVTIAASSSLEKSFRQVGKSNCNKTVAEKIGSDVAKKAAAKGVKQVVFDKGGYKYHGVVKALADAARQVLEF